MCIWCQLSASAESLAGDQATLNSSLSLVLMQRARRRTLRCLSTAFNRLDSERAFYNPDLGSSRILCLIFAALWNQSFWPASDHFSAMIVISWTIWKVQVKGLTLMRFLLWISLIFVWRYSFSSFPLTASLPVFFPFSDDPCSNWYITNPSSAEVSEGILMTILELLELCNRYYAVLSS